MSESGSVSDLVVEVVESFFETSNESGDIEWFVDRLPLMTFSLKLSLEAWIVKLNNSLGGLSNSKVSNLES